MRLTIVIDMDGAAFEGDDAGAEVARILRAVATAGDGWSAGELARLHGRPLRDVNGNACGRVVIHNDDESSPAKLTPADDTHPPGLWNTGHGAEGE